ncbi:MULTISPECIES: aldehyde dehydrogenase family protein [Methanoculleus]|uniref:Aldehyde dehydrogenase n=2 Tax=Methanoculleus TaxID=45989 RepID=A3CSZ2_METMJ|nr:MULTISPECIES: aldehyde dehydrogenase family protein [Methanoculleus]ABN56492.1 aldehyde dehydrogenase [Methanoculleus marisnigri JR1]MCC7556815.1 aldehyde dehydrogenase family protein [Methanoculleus marisnigri]UYU17933.1 aldehyde dehydrogenase family protein [Methanoculleus submarinus]
MTEPRGFLVGGEWRTSTDILDVRFPYTGEVVGRVCLAGSDDVEDALRCAERGFSLTRRLPAHRRSEILYNLADLIRERSAELTGTIMLEAGKTRALAESEVVRARETIEVSAEEARRIDGTILPLDWNAAGEGRVGCLRRFPLGPVLAITPFNFPLNLACHKLGPAIGAGDSVVLKPASATPISSLMLGEMALDAGIPPEAVSVVPCHTDLAERMVRDDRVACVSFTGSPAVGWHLREIAGRKRVGLELGGNAAVVVHEDADIPFAAGRIVAGAFSNAGQTCIAVQRVYLHRPIYEEALALLVERARALTTGDPREPGTDVGPMISAPAAETAFAKVEDAIAGGAKVLVGGTRDGPLFKPTILVDTTPDMAVNRTEVFAPVVTVAPYETFEEAIAFANDTEYGLQAGIFTHDSRRIAQAFEELRVGGLVVNDISTFRMDHAPYGGVRGSGIGREGPKYAIEEMTEERMMIFSP